MTAYIFSLIIPMFPLFMRKLYKKEEKLSTRETIFRYIIYTFLITVITTCAMVFLCDKGTSFMEKVDKSPIFTLKFLAVQVLAALITAGVEWWYETRRLEIIVDIPSFRKHIAVRFLCRAAFWGIYLLAIFTTILNVTLIFDNVLWGDEAYSANLMRSNLPNMMKIISLEDPHPPLYYLWLKMWVELLGYSGMVFHLATLFAFFINLILAVTLVRKRYGNIPTAFLIVFTGMSEMCLIYNVEIRMYALAFLAVTFCYYSAGRILEENKLTGWVGMVFWGLVAAYSHYFALLMVTIMMVTACLLAVKRFGKKTWIRTITGGIVFIAGYMPWMQFLFKSVNRVKDDWWLEESVPLDSTVEMIFGGSNMTRILFPLVMLMLLLFFFVESAVAEGKRTEEKILICVQAPRASTWSAECSTLFVGLVTIVLTVVIAYSADIVYRPILSQRYVYPLGGVVAMMLVIGGSRFLQLLKDRQEVWKKTWFETVGKSMLLFILAGLMLTGIKDYRQVSAEVAFQSTRTEAVLALIGEPTEDMVLVNNGVKHIGWTVLHYYYPNAEIINDNYNNIEADDFWYFTSNFLSEQDFSVLLQKGYELGGYGEQQISTYKFVLYHFYK